MEEKVIESLRTVFDPEISVNVYDLGLIYEIKIEGSHCNVKHTLTSMMCPFADEICQNIYDAVIAIDGIDTVNRELVFDPPFTIDSISEDIRMAMGMYDSPFDNYNNYNSYDDYDSFK